MPTRMTPSQFRSRIRQLEQKRRQAIDKVKRSVTAINQANRRAVDEYNRRVRAYNARVRADRQRLIRAVNQLSQRRVVTHLVSFRASIQSVQYAHSRLENVAASIRLGPEYNRMLDLSERETANSVEVMNALLEPDGSPPRGQLPATSGELIPMLRGISPDLEDRWRGALFALHPDNRDAARHFCTSAREILTGILADNAPDHLVSAAIPDCERTQHGKPTRRAKLHYCLLRQGLELSELRDFCETDIANVLELFDVFNAGTHGSAGKLSIAQLYVLRKRVEDSILFVVNLVRKQA